VATLTVIGEFLTTILIKIYTTTVTTSTDLGNDKEHHDLNVGVTMLELLH